PHTIELLDMTAAARDPSPVAAPECARLRVRNNEIERVPSRKPNAAESGCLPGQHCVEADRTCAVILAVDRKIAATTAEIDSITDHLGAAGRGPLSAGPRNRASRSIDCANVIRIRVA